MIEKSGKVQNKLIKMGISVKHLLQNDTYIYIYIRATPGFCPDVAA